MRQTNRLILKSLPKLPASDKVAGRFYPMEKLTLFLLLIAVFTHSAPASQRPNVIFIFTDDHGYTDIGAHGHDPDVRTPHLDQLARDGVRFTRGYVTAPQCVPSRAGIVAGRHQNAFGLEENRDGPLSLKEFTVAERLQEAGYITGMIGKWHLENGFNEHNEPYFSRNHLPDRHGFEEMFMGYMQLYHANYDLEGNRLPDYQLIQDEHFRIDIQTRAALSFLERRKTDDRPFFLYLCWFAPHSPIEGPPQYMERLSHVESPTRREALASVLAMDDGLGMIREKLTEMGIADNTLIFFISDNGAPLFEGVYIGSNNDPLVGEKGMLIDGGLRVPFIAAWPGTIPGGQVFDEMVWSLDAAATTVALANAPTDERIEGINLMPWLTGERSGPVHEQLYWRWRSQATLMTNDWTFVRVGKERRYLFPTAELGAQRAEHNRIDEFPEIAGRLESDLKAIAAGWATTGLPEQMVDADRRFFDVHVERSLSLPPKEDRRTCAHIPWDKRRPQTAADAPTNTWQAVAMQRGLPAAPTGSPPARPRRLQEWFVRQGNAVSCEAGIEIVSNRLLEPTFLGREFADGLVAPVTVEVEARASRPTRLELMWLPAGQDSEEAFASDPAAVLNIPAGEAWSTVRSRIPSSGNIARLRLMLEGNGEIPVEVRAIRLHEANGNTREFNF